MIVEKYEREAELIARRLYHKDWARISGNLRREIYEMAVDVVCKRESGEMDRFPFTINRRPDDNTSEF